MASTAGIRAGKAYVELSLHDRLTRGLRRAQARLRAFGETVGEIGKKMAMLGTAVLAPLAASAKEFSSTGDQVAKMAKRTGLSVETLSELKFVASQTGTEFESLEMAFRKMQRSIYDAGRGLATQTDALRDLGLTFKDLDGLSPERQFKLLADRFAQLPDPTKRAAIAMVLFGRTGTNLLPMFAAGARGIEALQRVARSLGLTMSSEAAKQAEDFTDALDRLWKVIKMGVFEVGGQLALSLTQLITDITAAIVTVRSFIAANRGWVGSMVKAAAAVLGVGVALMGLAKIFTMLAGAIRAAIGVVRMFNAALLALKAMNPILLLISLAIAAIVGFLAYDVGGKVFGTLTDKYREFEAEWKKNKAEMDRAMKDAERVLEQMRRTEMSMPGGLDSEQMRKDLAAQKERLRLQRIAEANARRQQTIEELQLRMKYKGIELERRLLELRKRQALIAASAAGENVELVRREYRLRWELLQARYRTQMAQRNLGPGAVGGFYARHVTALLGGGPIDRVAQYTKQTASNTKKLVQKATPLTFS